MSTFVFEGQNRFYLGARAHLLENDREVASDWAQKHIVSNPAHAWVLGRFVESDKANNNNQYFSLEDLRVHRPTIANAPLNINHSARNIVGAFVASDLIYPDTEDLNPYIESLGVVWRYYFPEEYQQVQKANAEGSLFYSMEAVPRAVASVGGSDDSVEYPYEGRTSPNYPAEINERTVPVRLIDPHFVGGALIIPPVKPGWSNADVKQVAKFMNERWQDAELAYAGIQAAAPDLDPASWEALMGELILADYELEVGKTFSKDKRDKLAKEGKAMPDGSYPIEGEQDLKNAIQAIGRAKNPAATKAHIKKRAKALGLTNLIPEGW